MPSVTKNVDMAWCQMGGSRSSRTKAPMLPSRNPITFTRMRAVTVISTVRFSWKQMTPVSAMVRAVSSRLSRTPIAVHSMVTATCSSAKPWMSQAVFFQCIRQNYTIIPFVAKKYPFVRVVCAALVFLP